MGLLSWAEKKIRNLNVWDFGLVKVLLVLSGIIIGAYISAFVKQYAWYFGSAFAVLYIIALYRVFKKK